MAKISIVIPLYNAGKSVKRCLKSISRQSFTDYELIIINDGSTDDSEEYVKSLIKKYDNLADKTRIITRQNSGIAKTRNYGLSVATGKYVAFIDQDDFISDDYLDSYFYSAELSSADIVVGGYERVSSSGKILSRRVTPNTDWGKYPNIMPWAHIYRREFLVSNNIAFLDCNIGEDIYFNVLAYQLTDKICIIPDVGYKWFFNDQSVSNTLHTSLDNGYDEIRLYNALYDKLKEMGKENESFIEYFFLRSICHNFLYSVRHSHKDSVTSEYLSIMRWLRERYPGFVGYIIKLGKPKGEGFIYYLATLLFFVSSKPGLLLPILKLLAKND